MYNIHVLAIIKLQTFMQGSQGGSTGPVALYLKHGEYVENLGDAAGDAGGTDAAGGPHH